ncbi:MAG: hypothetical protein NTZ90_08105 [Proteobacteria bacterium]|nr:hypothetical protein [Pseudomonadota bacterium]
MNRIKSTTLSVWVVAVMVMTSGGCGSTLKKVGLKPKTTSTSRNAASAPGQADAATAAAGKTCPTAASTSTSVNSYAATAEPVIKRACLSCHATQAPLMNTAAQASAQGAAIVAASVAGRMPPGAPLAAADLAALQSWAGGGFAQLYLAAATPPTYEGTIKPMMLAKCAWCYSSTAAANVRTRPYLTTLAETQSAAASVYAQMNSKQMPPAGAVPALAADDAATFAAWRTAGYPVGTPPPVVAPGQSVYYLGAVDGLLAANCVGCHGAGLTAPDLSNYQGAQAAGPALLTAIQAGRMPPSGALSSAIQAEFKAWSDAGFPYDAAATPPPPPPPAPAPAPAPSPAPAANPAPACPPI